MKFTSNMTTKISAAKCAEIEARKWDCMISDYGCLLVGFLKALDEHYDYRRQREQIVRREEHSCRLFDILDAFSIKEIIANFKAEYEILEQKVKKHDCVLIDKAQHLLDVAEKVKERGFPVDESTLEKAKKVIESSPLRSTRTLADALNDASLSVRNKRQLIVEHYVSILTSFIKYRDALGHHRQKDESLKYRAFHINKLRKYFHQETLKQTLCEIEQESRTLFHTSCKNHWELQKSAKALLEISRLMDAYDIHADTTIIDLAQKEVKQNFVLHD